MKTISRQNLSDPEFSAKLLEKFVDDWCRDNYCPEVCENGQHVIVKALSTKIRFHIVNELGDIAKYWMLMFSALRYWFKSDDDCEEIKYVGGRLEIDGAMLEQAGSPNLEEFDYVYREYRHWIGKPLKHWREN